MHWPLRKIIMSVKTAKRSQMFADSGKVKRREAHKPRVDPLGGRRDVIRVSLDIHSGTTRFRAAVWAESIQQALGLASRCYPGCEASVVFPIPPEDFFAEGSPLVLGTVIPEVPEEATG
jgi:hypothetical protein